MSTLKELEEDLRVLTLKLEQFKASKFEFCDNGYTVFSDGSTGINGMEKTKNFAAINKTKNQAIKRRRMIYLQNVEFQLAEHFNVGEDRDWRSWSEKYNIVFDAKTRDYIIMNCIRYKREGSSYFIPKEAAEKALPYYIEAVERYDRGEV